MQQRNRRILAAGAALLALVSIAAQHPRATIEILTHDQGDTAPRRVQAAIDLGLVGISVLVTWSKRLRY